MKASTTTAVLAAGCLAMAATAAEGRQLKIVATSFPHYDWTREVLGERLAETDLVLLQQSGVDLHSYSPSAADLRQIAACDLFVFVGGESDEWTERALAQKGNPRRRILNLVKTLGSAAKEEKIVEGMVDELQLPVILVIEGTRHKIAETVKRTTKTKGQRILTLDSLQSTGGEAAKTTRYLDVMTRNLETLKAALN